jgi:hypothetical protein
MGLWINRASLNLSSKRQRDGRLNVMTKKATSKHDSSRNQGEGDRESAKRYNEATREFVQSGKVDDAAEYAEQDPEEAKESERKGRQHARELDPAVHRDYQKPEK